MVVHKTVAATFNFFGFISLIFGQMQKGGIFHWAIHETDLLFFNGHLTATNLGYTGQYFPGFFDIIFITLQVNLYGLIGSITDLKRDNNQS